MSTVNPDDRDRSIGLLLRPLGLVLGALVQLIAPGAALLSWLGIVRFDGWLLVGYIGAWLVAGLLLIFTSGSRSPHLFAVGILTYIGGLFAVIAIGVPEDDFDGFNALMIVAPYAVSIVLLVLYRLGESARRRTREIGVDTIATVVSAPITGMVNYVTRQRLTLKFTDQQGVERYVRVGRTGGGYSPGDQIPIRYDPTRPWSTRSILVEGSGPTLFDGRRLSG